MTDNVLYIIGNGFDRHHDVENGYNSFRDWLKRNDPELYHVYSSVCRYDALWSDFENGLAYVDRDYDVPESIRWNVSHYNDEEKEKFQQILTNLGINVTTQVQFHSLSHWQIHK